MALTAEQIKKIAENPDSVKGEPTKDSDITSQFIQPDTIKRVAQEADYALAKAGEEPSYTYKDLKTQAQKNWRAIGLNVLGGLNDAGDSLAQTVKAGAEFLQKGSLTGKYVINKQLDSIIAGLDKMHEGAEYQRKVSAEANAEADDAVRLLNNWVVRPTMSSLPNTVLALMTGGSSEAARIGAKSAGLVGQLFQQLLKNPQFYASAVQMFGPTYYDAKESGATEEQAMWTALLNSALGSVIEVGATPESGGLESYLKGNKNSFLDFVKSIPEEGKEEVLQGILERLLQKTVAGNDDIAWASVDPDKEAVINPATSAQEFLGGAIVGGVLGGTTYTVNAVIDNVNKAKMKNGVNYAALALDTASKTGVDTEISADVANIAYATKTPVVWVDTLGGTADGGMIRGVFKDGVVVLAKDSAADAKTVAAHELTHSIENTAAYQSIVSEIDAERKSGGLPSLNEESAALQALYKDKMQMDISLQEAKNEAVAMYVEKNLDTSAAAWEAVRSYNDGFFTRFLQNRIYNRQYASADADTRQRMQLHRRVSEGLRQRTKVPITPEQIRAIAEEVQGTDSGGAQRSIQYNSNQSAGRNRYSREATVNSIGEITISDVEPLRSVGKKSINDFTSEDIKKSEKWARKFYQELGTKSPFFRAWFGDWRAYDKNTKRRFIAVNTSPIDATDVSRAGAKNTDTGWTVSVSRNGIDETANKRGKWSAEYRSLVSINDMLTNAVLLDTICVNKPSKRLGNSAAFVHHMYCPISIDGVNAIAKLYVTEEVGNINKFYLTKIEMVPTDSTVLGKNAFAPNSSVDTEISVADICDFVKRNNDKYEADSDEPTTFNPKPVNPAMLNADGTPKVVYHGTDTDFNVFASKDGTYWFSESKDYAESMAEERGGKRIVEAYLNMRNPMTAKLPLGQFSDPNYEAAIIRRAKAGGYDGVIIETDTEQNDLSYEKFYVAFSPTQIKSATDNIGTFNGSNPDIRYSLSGVNAGNVEEQLAPYIKQYGGMNLPDREIDVPKAVDESGQKVSQTASTYLNATDDLEMRSRTVDGVISKKFNYNPMKISEMDRKTRERIENAGYEKWAERVAEDAETDDGVGISLDRVEQYKILMRMAMERGDYDTAQNCQMLLWPMVSEAAKIMNLQQDIFLKGLDGKRMAKLVKKQAEDKINNEIAEKAKKSRGEVPQETIDRLKEQKAELEKDYRAATETAVEKQRETQGLQRHLNDLQKGIEQTVSDQTKTDKQTAKLAEKLAQKMQEAAAAVSDYAASEEKYQKTKQELREAREELRRLERQTNKNNREEYQYLWDLLLVNESMEKAVEEQRQSSERLRETKEALERSKDYRKLKAELQKLGAGVEVDPNLMAELENAKTPEEIDIAKAHIFQNIADQLPPTPYERFMSWRYLAMLGNPKTWIKNEVGNLANYGLHKMDNLIAYALQRFCVREGDRVVALNWRHTDAGKAIADKIEKAADAAAEREGSHKYDDARGSINELRRSFNSDVLEKASGKLDIALNEGGAVMLSGGKLKKLGAGDKPMFRKNYVEALGNYMVAKGLTEVTAEADAYATDVAQAYVFHKDNAISQAVTKLRNSGKGWQIAVDSLMPFIRTPANVLAQGLERSPIGFAAAAVKLTKAAINQKRGTGSVSPELINSMARSTTGTVLFILGVIASAIGLAAGDEEGDNAKERSAGELSGAQDLSLDIFGTKISFDWLEPASYPFLLGVLINDGFEKDNALGSLLDAASAGYSQVFDMSMLSGLLDAFTSNYDDGSQMVAQAVAAVFENAATQSIPTLVGQLARAIDPVKRKTTSGESWITDVLGKNLVSDAASTVVSRIPFASKTLEAERDVFGNEVGRVGDKNAFALNAFQQVLSPAAIKKKNTVDDKSDTVSRMLSQLYEDTEKTKVIPTEMTAKKFKEKLSDEGLESAYTSELYRQTKIDVGQAQLEALWELMEANKPVELTETYTTASGKEKRRTYTKRYADMTDEEKTKAIQKAAQKAKDDTLEQLWEEFEKEAKKK